MLLTVQSDSEFTKKHVKEKLVGVFTEFFSHV